MPLIRTETSDGEPMRAGNYEITPTNWVLKIHIPNKPGAPSRSRSGVTMGRSACSPSWM
jgi:hypothetical protein